MKDHAYHDRQALITGTMTAEEKLRRAKQVLGERYLCHPVNHVKRNPRREPEISKTDVARTFRRWQQRAPGARLV